MFIVGNLFIAIASVADTILYLYMWLIIISAVISWVNPDPYNPIVKFLHSVTDPVIREVRRRMPAFGGLDFSPLIVILVIMFIRFFIIESLDGIGRRLV